jgi:hypothetical protein
MIAGAAVRWEWSGEMGFLSWIKRPGAGRQQPVVETKKPETAKQMYTRENAQERANRTPMDRMSEEQRAKVDAIKERLQKATQHIDRNGATPSPESSSGGREATRQNMTAQEKAAPALSPTSVQAGKTPLEKPVKAPEKPKERPQTVPRPRPSWER